MLEEMHGKMITKINGDYLKVVWFQGIFILSLLVLVCLNDL